jgi:hypothetical protein
MDDENILLFTTLGSRFQRYVQRRCPSRNLRYRTVRTVTRSATSDYYSCHGNGPVTYENLDASATLTLCCKIATTDDCERAFGNTTYTFMTLFETYDTSRRLATIGIHNPYLLSRTRSEVYSRLASTMLLRSLVTIPPRTPNLALSL